jgi:hypothetical protein
MCGSRLEQETCGEFMKIIPNACCMQCVLYGRVLGEMLQANG